jgi:hypothetical protein
MSTLTLPRRRRSLPEFAPVSRPVEGALRDIAYVLHLTRKVSDEIRAARRTPAYPSPLMSERPTI